MEGLDYVTLFLVGALTGSFVVGFIKGVRRRHKIWYGTGKESEAARRDKDGK